MGNVEIVKLSRLSCSFIDIFFCILCVLVRRVDTFLKTGKCPIPERFNYFKNYDFCSAIFCN